ncbi:MAG TPA: YraN family protein [Ruminococcaceae bacterium]|nr:YraN family protein [Oscillospiraceae bacterium]
MNIKRVKGDVGEELTVKWLKRHRYKIIQRNFSCRWGEIDVIAQKGDVLCFTEVKTREIDSYGRPAEAVDYRKQQRILKTANVYLTQNPCDLQPRFDVAEVVTEKGKLAEINYIENAFGE